VLLLYIYIYKCALLYSHCYNTCFHHKAIQQHRGVTIIHRFYALIIIILIGNYIMAVF
jgi:hypothetical protein